MSELYHVIFRGNILPGHALPEVKNRLGQLLKLDDAKLATVFGGKPVIIRRDCDAATAEKVKTALAKAGADAEIRSVAPTAPAAQFTPVSVQGAINRAPTTGFASSTDGLKVAPVGQVMTEVERAALRKPPVQVDISHITVEKRVSSFMVADDSPVNKLKRAEIQAPDFGVAAVGVDLLKPDEKRVFEELELDLSGYEVAELGADMLPEDQNIPLPLMEMEELDADLAPVGSDLGQLKKAPPPPPPKIDHLRLI